MKYITSDHLKIWLDRLAGQHDLVAPRDVDGHVLYRPVTSAAEVLFDYERPELSAREYFLPATETILRIEKKKQEVIQQEVLPERTQVIFGIRPCDAHGLAVIDALFLNQEPLDRYYAYHRQRTTLIGLSCPQLWDGCFCTSVGGGPDQSTFLDLLLRREGEGYTIEVVTAKGEALLEGAVVEERPLKPPDPEVGVMAAANPLPVSAPEKWRRLFGEERLWMRYGERCLSCRLCTYVCPACRCFDVTDRVVAERGGVTHIERIRVWDACTSPNYRRVAGGHNPRPTKAERLRNRFLCKFCYYPMDFGPLGCVGCGRCVVSCPVNVDITEVMREVAEYPEA